MLAEKFDLDLHYTKALEGAVRKLANTTAY